MANQANINPTPDVKAIRNIARIKRLEQALDKAKARGDVEKQASILAEYNRRIEEVRALKAALAEVDAG